MQRWVRATAAIAGSAALAGVTMAAAAGAAFASGAHDNFAYGSYAPAATVTSRLHGLAESPPAETTTVANVNVTSLLSTGFTNDTASPGGASSRIAHVSASTSWTSASTTYTFSLTARNVASFCSNTSSSASVSPG